MSSISSLNIAISKYRITMIDDTVESIRVYRLEPVVGKIPTFIPGQFAFLHMLDKDGRSMDKRPYSIASSPSAQYIELCIKMVEGRFTSKLKTLKTGTIVGLEQPIGHFVYEGQKNAAFIAGGTGLAPFVSMLRYIADKKLEGKFVLFYSAKTSDSIVYKDEFARLEQKNPNIKVVVTLTQECKGWCGEQGRINNEMIQKYILDPKEFAWWMCGPLEMVKCMRENLIIIGANPKNINMEGWG